MIAALTHVSHRFGQILLVVSRSQYLFEFKNLQVGLSTQSLEVLGVVVVVGLGVLVVVVVVVVVIVVVVGFSVVVLTLVEPGLLH